MKTQNSRLTSFRPEVITAAKMTMFFWIVAPYELWNVGIFLRVHMASTVQKNIL